MVFIQFEAMPPQAVSSRENVAGAYINCWIHSDDAAEAEQRAREWTADEDWVIVSVEECRPVDVQSEVSGPNGPYIREALESGGSLVFHQWPPEGEERSGNALVG
jgi:hypothetical protein